MASADVVRRYDRPFWEVSERLTGEPFDVAARLATATP